MPTVPWCPPYGGMPEGGTGGGIIGGAPTLDICEDPIGGGIGGGMDPCCDVPPGKQKIMSSNLYCRVPFYTQKKLLISQFSPNLALTSRFYIHFSCSVIDFP